MLLGLTASVAAAWTPYTSLVVGMLAAALIPYAAWALTPRRPPAPLHVPPARAPQLLPAEQRRAVRRSGNAVPVVVREGRTPSYQGFVINRSAGGLCLTVPRPVAAGAGLEVRVAAAPDGSPWLRLVVVHTTVLGAGVWRVGCQFTEPPPRGGCISSGNGQRRPARLLPRLPLQPGLTWGAGPAPRGGQLMRFLCLLFLLAFLGAVGIFAWQNQGDVAVAFLRWGYTGSLALVVGAAYLLGMLSGWSVVGMLRRSFRRASTILDERRANAPAGW